MKPGQLMGGAILNRAPISSDATGAFSDAIVGNPECSRRWPRPGGKHPRPGSCVGRSICSFGITRLGRPVARDLRRIHGYPGESNTERTSNDEQRRPSDHPGNSRPPGASSWASWRSAPKSGDVVASGSVTGAGGRL